MLLLGLLVAGSTIAARRDADRGLELAAQLGVIDPQAGAEHTFLVEAPWDEPVPIISTRVGCSACTTLVEAPTVLRPGSPASVTIAIRPGNERGPRSYTAALIGTGGRVIRFRLDAVVRGGRVVPAEVHLGDVPAGLTVERSIRVESYGLPPGRLVVASCPPPFSIRMLDESRGADALRQEVTAAVAARSDGPLHVPRRAVARLELRHRETGALLEAFAMPITATVVGDVHVHPRGVFFGRVIAGTVAARAVALSAPAGHALPVGARLDAVSTPRGARVAVRPLDPSPGPAEGGPWRLEVALETGARARGVLSGHLLLVAPERDRPLAIVRWLAIVEPGDAALGAAMPTGVP